MTREIWEVVGDKTDSREPIKSLVPLKVTASNSNIRQRVIYECIYKYVCECARVRNFSYRKYSPEA